MADLPFSEPLRSRLCRIRLLIMDVDGVLTDGKIVYDDTGGESKAFHVADGMGLALLQESGIRVAWVTGRTGGAVKRRASELGVTVLLQGVRDKGRAIENLLAPSHVETAQTAYIGDDWNDLNAFEAVGVRIAVANAVRELKTSADLITTRAGGEGAVREVCEWILEAQEMRQVALERYLAGLRTRPDSGPVSQ